MLPPWFSKRYENDPPRMKPTRDTTARCARSRTCARARWSLTVMKEGARAGSGSWLTVRRLSSGFAAFLLILCPGRCGTIAVTPAARSVISEVFLDGDKSRCWVAERAAVESIPGKLSGAWLFNGIRLPVATIIENLEDLGIDEVMEQFDVTAEFPSTRYAPVMPVAATG